MNTDKSTFSNFDQGSNEKENNDVFHINEKF